MNGYERANKQVDELISKIDASMDRDRNRTKRTEVTSKIRAWHKEPVEHKLNNVK